MALNASYLSIYLLDLSLPLWNELYWLYLLEPIAPWTFLMVLEALGRSIASKTSLFLNYANIFATSSECFTVGSSVGTGIRLSK